MISFKGKMSDSPNFVIRQSGDEKRVCPSCNLPRNIDNFKGNTCIFCASKAKLVPIALRPKVESKPDKPTKICQSCGRELADSPRNYENPKSIDCKDCDRHNRACHMTDKFHPDIVNPEMISR